MAACVGAEEGPLPGVAPHVGLQVGLLEVRLQAVSLVTLVRPLADIQLLAPAVDKKHYFLRNRRVYDKYLDISISITSSCPWSPPWLE